MPENVKGVLGQLFHRLLKSLTQLGKSMFHFNIGARDTFDIAVNTKTLVVEKDSYCYGFPVENSFSSLDFFNNDAECYLLASASSELDPSN